MKTDALGRRLRFAPPNPVIRELMLGDADILVFEAINRHGPLPSHYLFEFTKHLRKDWTRTQKRLTELYNGDATGPYLTRPPQQFAGFEARYQHIVCDLAPRAQSFIMRRPARKDPFLHQLMTACVGASLELGAPAKGLRYLSRDSVFNHTKCPLETKEAANPLALPLHGFGERGTLIPDDLFGFEYPGVGFRFFAVEIDRNTESIERKNLEQNSFGRKVTAYLQVLRERAYQEWWGIPNLTVLTVTTNATHAMNLSDYVRKQAEPKYAERFAFTSNTDFGPNWRVPKTVLSHLLDEPWATPTRVKDIAKA